MRYDSPEHLENYKATKVFPKIHNNLAVLIQQTVEPGKTAVDLGSCYGLMTVRLVEELGWKQALGIEPNKKYYAQSIEHPQAKYLNMKITEEELNGVLGALLNTLRPELIVARRVFPEINEQNPKALFKLVDICKALGVTVALEGRNPHHQPTNVLNSAEKEVAIFKMAGYGVIANFRNCYILKI